MESRVRKAGQVSAKLTSKGQVTIPKEVRTVLGIDTGDRVTFTLRDGEAVLRPAPRGDLMRLAGIFAGRVPFAGCEAERQEAMKQAAREALDSADEIPIEDVDF